MRILSIQIGVPFSDAATGLDLRNAALLKALQEIGALSLLVLRREGLEAAPKWLDVRTLKGESRRSIWNGRRHTRPLSYAFSAAEKQSLQEAIAALRPDVAIVEGVLLRDSMPLLKALGVPTVLDMHNIESDLLAETFRNRTWRFWPGNLLQEAIQKHTAKSEDKAAALAADRLWLCSQNEVEDLGDRWGVAASVVPNPVHDDRLFDLPITPERYSAANLVFVGHMRYGPNRKAIIALCKQVRAALPAGATLTFVGRNHTAQQEKMIAASRALLVKSAPDILPHMAEASYSIMPITYGGGTRIKVIEALAAGVLMIGTQKAVEGLGLVDGTHYLNGETPDAMVDLLNAALSNPAKTAEIAQNGRAFVQQEFGPKAILAAARSGIESLTDS